jgi:hypothetical protein
LVQPRKAKGKSPFYQLPQQLLLLLLLLLLARALLVEKPLVLLLVVTRRVLLNWRWLVPPCWCWFFCNLLTLPLTGLL